ncbi:MAG TPA: hypothetical protein VK807_24095 [Gemmatimonadaceae bacterium]|nr:hypothetical protein [Gemmatimonadaceae bacterium]
MSALRAHHSGRCLGVSIDITDRKRIEVAHIVAAVVRAARHEGHVMGARQCAEAIERARVYDEAKRAHRDLLWLITVHFA